MQKKLRKIDRLLRETGIAGVFVMVCTHEMAGGRYNVYAWLQDEDHNRLLPGVEHGKEGVREEELALVREIVSAWCIQDLPEVAKTLLEDSEHLYSTYFESLTQETRESLAPATWIAQSTVERALGSFKTILKYLDRYGVDITENDFPEIEQWIKDSAIKHTRAKGDAEKTEHGTVARKISEFNQLYQAFREVIGVNVLPPISLREIKRKDKYVVDSIREVSDERIVEAFYLCKRLLPFNRLTPAGINMLVASTRTAESTPVRVGDILDCGEYGVYGVLEQGKGTIRKENLKTIQSGRLIVLQNEIMEVYRFLRGFFAERYGKTGDELNEYCFSPAKDRPTDPADEKEVSRFLRDVLKAVGVTENHWEQVEVLMQQSPDYDSSAERKPLRDPVAYTCRHAGANRMIYQCGILPMKVDAAMGHEIPDWCPDYHAILRRPDEWPVFAAELSRFVFDPETTTNPAFRNAVFDRDAEFQINGRFVQEMSVDVKETVRVELILELPEPGDVLTVWMPVSEGEPEVQVVPVDLDPDRTPVLGPLHDLEWYRERKRRADEIDLTPFLKEAMKW